MYANSMHINRTNYKYTLNIDSSPYRNAISFGLFSNSVQNKCSNVPTNAALCAVYGTQELLDRILARRVNLQYEIFIDLLQAFHVVLSDSGLRNVKQFPGTTSHCLTKLLCNNFSVGRRIDCLKSRSKVRKADN